MSLLLEALKKAEKAKEEAQRRAREGGDAADASAAEGKAVVTRDRLPDISRALELVPDEVPPPNAPQRPAILERAPEPKVEPPPPPPPPKAAAAPAPKPAPRAAATKPPAPDADTAGRASAKKVFEAKLREPNPRMPFYITMGALGVFAVGTVVYFWYQLRPPPSLVNLNPQTTQTAQAQPAETRAPAAPAAPAAQNAIPGLPPTTPAPPKTPAASATPAVPMAKPPAPRALAEAAPVEAPRLTPRLQPARPAPASAAAQAPVVTRAPAQVNPRVDAGYAAYIAGDLVASREAYEQAVREDPSNRDALLGLAALDVRAGRYETAEAMYLRVLGTDPRDTQAQAALIALRSGRADPLATESRVKTMLAADPGAHALNFTLGNQLASQKRWAEAQQEYFKAYTAEPDNADFAYNLAVSLDHLRQSRQALDYYQRAITLAEKRGASFDLNAAKSRAAQLQ